LNNGSKRFYVSHPSLNLYTLEQEILPSGNKVFYEYDDHCRPKLIKMTETSEKKVLSWIRIQYDRTIHVDSSDGQTVDYQLEENSSGGNFLTKVIRSNKPSIQYQYRVVDESVLLVRKDLPEGRFTEVDYYTDKAHKNKVKSVTTPAGVSGTTSTQFVYGFEAGGSGSTEIYGPLDRKTVHRFNEDLQLISIEQYLDRSLYRVQKWTWGKKRDATHLIGTTIEDESGNVYYAKTLSYDGKGNVLEEREYGNLTGASPHQIAIDEDGNPEASQESHVKTYSYHSKKDIDVVNQKDAKGNGVEFVYKKGTNLLIKKFVIEKGGRKKRWFYDYNEDGALTQIIVDDGDEDDAESTYDVHERLITQITPKKELPHIGAPEVIEEKYLDVKKGKEVLLKRIVNHFDLQGNITSTDVYDASGEHRYTLKRIYESGLLKMESDPAGNETTYSYDGNHNLTAEINAATGASFEYGYDLKNRPIYTAEKDAEGNIFEAHASYDSSGYKLSEIDRFGNETIYYPDDLGRVQSVSYPDVRDGENASTKPTYTYQYDLFDHAISITDPRGEITLRAYTLRGQPTKIQYPDGTQQLFKYDAEGSLHRHLNKDGTVKVFEYDYLGRLEHIEHYARGGKESGEWLSSVRYSYDAFHMTSEEDEEKKITDYTYDGNGRLVSLSKGSKKIKFLYDTLGRTRAIKTWKTSTTFTLQVKEYDLLDRVVEERTEDSKGNILLKYKYVYNKAGLLAEVIGFPQNQESTLKKYDYDGFGRPIKIRDAFNHITEIIYDDRYINSSGQKVLKQTTIDPLGNEREEIFDTAGRLAKVSQKNKQGLILAESEYICDAAGNELLEKNVVIFSGELLKTYATEQTYGPGSQLKTIKHAAHSQDERTISFDYNSYGDLSTKLWSGAKTPITYQYHNDGKLKSVSYQEESSDKKFTHKLSYDKKGNITEIKLKSIFTLAHKFDANNELISATIQDEFSSYQVGYTLDGEGLIQSVQLPDGSFVEYDYEGPFVKRVSRLTKEKKELYNYRVASRDLMGNILEEILIGHAGARTQKWDQACRRIEISTDFFQDKIPEGSYDPLQNIRKREVSLDDEKYTVDYDYNDLSNLISEKGEVERSYSFDSLGNRLKKDGSLYKLNDLNQVLEANGVIYTFDLNGNLASKTIGEKTWIFQHNALDQLVLIKDPDQTNVIFTYDLSGKRLSKKIEGKGKKSKVLRYFYVRETEIGCLDEKGVITELRVPGNPNHPENTPFIAVEIKKEAYAPIYDLQGNIACLVDPEQRKIVESYRYSAFGEEEITNERGRSISDSAVGNPWRYHGNASIKILDSFTLATVIMILN
jgi:YD repeat-containing protein